MDGTLHGHRLDLGPAATVDFVVGFGSNGNHYYGSTGLEVKIDIARSVDTDIHPGNYPNGVNPRSNGKIPVAIPSTDTFDAVTEVDQTSLTFGHAGDEPSLMFCDAHGEDVNGDGRLDLVCHFSMPLSGFLAKDTYGVLKGMTSSGVPIVGIDSVKIAGHWGSALLDPRVSASATSPGCLPKSAPKLELFVIHNQRVNSLDSVKRVSKRVALPIEPVLDYVFDHEHRVVADVLVLVDRPPGVEPDFADRADIAAQPKRNVGAQRARVVVAELQGIRHAPSRKGYKRRARSLTTGTSWRHRYRCLRTYIRSFMSH